MFELFLNLNEIKGLGNFIMLPVERRLFMIWLHYSTLAI